MWKNSSTPLIKAIVALLLGAILPISAINRGHTHIAKQTKKPKEPIARPFKWPAEQPTGHLIGMPIQKPFIWPTPKPVKKTPAEPIKRPFRWPNEKRV